MTIEIDWSKAPADATHWEMTEFGAVWSKEVNIDIGDPGKTIPGRVTCDGDSDFAPDFGFVGVPGDSLIARSEPGAE